MPSVKQSLLVVEDDTLLRMVAVDFLEAAGFHVIEADTADKGAQLLTEAQAVDGLFTDVETPGGLDGIGLARITHELHPHIGILVVSGRMGFDPSGLPPRARFLGKPYSSAVVLNALRELLA